MPPPREFVTEPGALADIAIPAVFKPRPTTMQTPDDSKATGATGAAGITGITGIAQPGSPSAPMQPVTWPHPVGITGSLPRRWAIVELFGHQRVAGAITETSVAGASFLQITIPAVEYTERWTVEGTPRERLHMIPEHSVAHPPSAIYGVHWVDEGTATLEAHRLRHEAIKPITLRATLDSLPAGALQRILGQLEDSVHGGL